MRHKRQDRTRSMFLLSHFTRICHAGMQAMSYDRLPQDANGGRWLTGNPPKTGSEFMDNDCRSQSPLLK